MAEAKAVLFVLLADGTNYTDVYSTPEYKDPELQAERMRGAVGDDMPGAIYAIGMNEEARVLMMNRRMREMGFPAEDYAEVLGG